MSMTRPHPSAPSTPGVSGGRTAPAPAGGSAPLAPADPPVPPSSTRAAASCSGLLSAGLYRAGTVVSHPLLDGQRPPVREPEARDPAGDQTRPPLAEKLIRDVHVARRRPSASRALRSHTHRVVHSSSFAGTSDTDWGRCHHQAITSRRQYGSATALQSAGGLPGPLLRRRRASSSAAPTSPRVWHRHPRPGSARDALMSRGAGADVSSSRRRGPMTRSSSSCCGGPTGAARNGARAHCVVVGAFLEGMRLRCVHVQRAGLGPRASVQRRRRGVRC
jgi:hypothetical protein